MSLKVNDVELDLELLRSLISKGQKINAIKYIKEYTNLGLKESKDNVDNLESDTYYYGNEAEISTKRPISDFEDNHQKAHNHNRKGSHIISEGNSNVKNYIILFLVVIIIVLMLIMY